MIDAPGQLADFRMQRAAERDVHFLKTPANAEQRHAAGDASLDQVERERISGFIIGLAARMSVMPEAARMHIGACAGQKNAIDSFEQCPDLGDLRRAGEHQRQRARCAGDRAQIALADPLRRELAFGQMRAADHADDGFLAGHLLSPMIPVAPGL